MNKTGDSRMVTAVCGILTVIWSCAQVVRADYTYGEPTLIPNVSMSGAGSPQVSPDGLELYFAYNYPGECRDLWVARRTTTKEPWGTPVPLDPPVNSPGPVGAMSISADGLELYFGEGHQTHWTSGCWASPQGYGSGDLWVSKRATKTDPWGAPQNLGATVNSTNWEDHPSLSADGLSLYFASERSGSCKLWMTTRPAKDAPWGTPAPLGAPLDISLDCTPFISPDDLALYFSVGMSPTPWIPDIYVSRRADATAPWGKPVPFAPVNSPIAEYHVSFSTEDSALYFTRANDIWSVYDLWQVEVLPIVDFNGDGRIDGQDVLAMARHWGQKHPLCDIGPVVWGDGIVDVEDLTVLAEHIGEEVVDSTLILHWALDETEGEAVHDSAGTNDGITVGDPSWRADGKIGGALAFDGKDDFVTSGKTAVDPAAGPFSVIAWIKGGAKNRVIVSQTPGVDWLYLNKDGMLATDLKASGKDGKTLVSSASLIDDQWHRVVFTWDGTNRVLGVDGVEVARDTQPSLAASSGKLNVGAGRTLAATSRWSGLIDDVRVYNRAVQP
ncbi:MAG: PD40 domain-containing protein [Sedimentisphaerales bacterium]|nr:PD40 domain-containing protein [Sedimentisphaerales bacterium]